MLICISFLTLFNLQGTPRCRSGLLLYRTQGSLSRTFFKLFQTFLPRSPGRAPRLKRLINIPLLPLLVNYFFLFFSLFSTLYVESLISPALPQGFEQIFTAMLKKAAALRRAGGFSICFYRRFTLKFQLS